MLTVPAAFWLIGSVGMKSSGAPASDRAAPPVADDSPRPFAVRQSNPFRTEVPSAAESPPATAPDAATPPPDEPAPTGGPVSGAEFADLLGYELLSEVDAASVDEFLATLEHATRPD
jgi:hypothetical protein